MSLPDYLLNPPEYPPVKYTCEACAITAWDDDLDWVIIEHHYHDILNRPTMREAVFCKRCVVGFNTMCVIMNCEDNWLGEQTWS